MGLKEFILINSFGIWGEYIGNPDRLITGKLRLYLGSLSTTVLIYHPQ